MNRSERDCFSPCDHPRCRALRRRHTVIAGILALTVAAMTAAISVHDVADATQQRAISLSCHFAGESLAIDPAGPVTSQRLDVASWHVFATDQVASVFMTMVASSSGVNGVAFSPDGKLVAGAYADGTVRVWNTVTGQGASQDSGGWLIMLASVIAIALSALAVIIITVWNLLPVGKRAR